MRRRIVKRTTISERRTTLRTETPVKTDDTRSERFRVTVVSDGPGGHEQIFDSGPLGEVSIDEGADGILRLIGCRPDIDAQQNSRQPKQFRAIGSDATGDRLKSK